MQKKNPVVDNKTLAPRVQFIEQQLASSAHSESRVEPPELSLHILYIAQNNICYANVCETCRQNYREDIALSPHLVFD